jgi:hypothetical protein
MRLGGHADSLPAFVVDRADPLNRGYAEEGTL